MHIPHDPVVVSKNKINEDKKISPQVEIKCIANVVGVNKD